MAASGLPLHARRLPTCLQVTIIDDAGLQAAYFLTHVLIPPLESAALHGVETLSAL